MATRFGREGARGAAMLLLTLRGTPLLYYGEEIGMTNAAIPPEYEQDPFGKRLRLSRDPQRTPMQWDAGPHAGFSAPTTPRLWLPVGGDYRQVNVEAQTADPRSLLGLYRRLIAFRRESTALVSGTYVRVDPVPPDCYAYLREAGAERVLVAINFGDQEHTFGVPFSGQGELVVSTALDRQGPVPLDAVRLRPHEGWVVELP
ncbi:MAG: DUF3459 domain-containing protein [Candidatus Latescibacterota bacterium]